MDVARSELDGRLYTRRFFVVFAAVVLFMTGAALQFHFGQYVEFLGHGVDTLGRIMSISTIGVLLVRFHIGRWIDRFGCRPTWIVGTLTVAASGAALQLAAALWAIVLLRTIWTISLAAVLTSLAVFAARIAPPQRRAESIGSMGLAGLLGIMVGPALGDWIFSNSTDSIMSYRVFFSVSAVLSLLSCGIIALLATPASRAAPKEKRAPSAAHSVSSTVRVVLRNWPGTILLVGVFFSMAFCVQMLFLERFAEERGFQNIKVFFFVYSPTAIALRLLLRRLPERFGRTPTVLMGMTLLGGGLFVLTFVHTQVQLVIPGLLMGAGHSFVFPSMVDLAAGRLPSEYRGTGTSLILGAGDLGTLIGFAALGELINSLGYATAFRLLGGAVLVAAATLAVSAAAGRRPERHAPPGCTAGSEP